MSKILSIIALILSLFAWIPLLGVIFKLLYFILAVISVYAGASAIYRSEKSDGKGAALGGIIIGTILIIYFLYSGSSNDLMNYRNFIH